MELPITDTPNSGYLPYNGQQSMYQLLFPYKQYIYNSRIADNLRTTDNGQVSCTERHFRTSYNGQGEGLLWAELENYIIIMVGHASKICLKTVRSVCVAQRQRFPKKGVKRFGSFRSTVRSVERSVPFRRSSTPGLPCDRCQLDKYSLRTWQFLVRLP